jgi:hypothetical protein
MLFLPEAADYISETKEQAGALATALNESAFLQGLQQTAQEEQIWVSAGVHEKVSDKQTVHVPSFHPYF